MTIVQPVTEDGLFFLLFFFLFHYPVEVCACYSPLETGVIDLKF